MRVWWSRLALLALFLTVGACSRAVSVGSEPGANYSILVDNNVARQVTVSWDDGSGTQKQLGTVSANSQDRFIVVSPARPNVTVYVRDSTGRTYGPYAVSLAPGTTQRVTVR